MCLSLWLGLAEPCLLAAQAGAVSSASPGTPKALFIEVLEGEGDLNDIRARTAREPIVKVEDENHRPVAGALVLFAADTKGGSTRRVNFSGTNNVTVRTDADGVAQAQGFAVFSKTGPVRILVKATAGEAVAQIVLHQTNYAEGSRLKREVSQHKLLVGSAVAAGVAVTLAILLTRNGGTTISAGTGTVRAVVAGQR